MMQSSLIRSMLSVPGVEPRFIRKAQDVAADIVLLDLEDSIAPGEKARAREQVRAALPGFDKRGRKLLVRPNGLDTGMLETDLNAIVCGSLDGIHLPKTHSPDVLRQADDYLTFLERTRDLPHGRIELVAWIESTQGVANVEAIAGASPRLIGLSMGAEDYATDLGVMRSAGAGEIEYARARVANAARARGLCAIDCPEPDYRDLEHFERDITHARTLGYTGKYCIHPNQVEIANRVFSPGAEQLNWAARVVDAYEEGERRGLGAVGLDGQMVDRPIYLRAQNIRALQARIEARCERIRPLGGQAD